MRLFITVSILFLFSCGQKKKAAETTPADMPDSLVRDSSSIPDSKAPAFAPGPGETAVNARLKETPGSEWVVVNDTMAPWPAGEFDYFIAPKRKDNPDYPYIATGDFNGDGQNDKAALVKNPGTGNYQVAILLENGPVIFWKEDIDLCALSVYPRGTLEGMDGGKKKMTGDGINVEFFEKATFVLYWDGKAFRRTYTGD
ncbi:MAG: hypothetical protein ACO25B_05535 [Chitinophagaceae bacterium]